MRAIGIDIGTTTVSAVVLDHTGRVEAAEVRSNGAFLPSARPWEKLQDPARLLTLAEELVKTMLERYPDAAGIGVTGQQHGIVYLNETGDPVSPLYTWQDGRGGLEYENGISAADYIYRTTGYPIAPGYGLATHFYLAKKGRLPEGAVTFCTICDYVAMKLCGHTSPALDPSHAASLGLYDLEQGAFSLRAMEQLGLDPAILPSLARRRVLGQGPGGLPVSVAIGDNQASFIGSTGGQNRGVLVNVGTGSQVSLYTPALCRREGLETRPFPGGGYLLVGASLCGGRAYALLEQFFRQTTAMVTGQERDCYAPMAELLAQGEPEDVPVISPTFAGTRQDPGLRGSITGLSTENLTPRHLIWAMLRGMTDELYDMYEKGAGQQSIPEEGFWGGGNGLRKNPQLCRLLEERFGAKLSLSSGQEEAACGAALFLLASLEQEG